MLDKIYRRMTVWCDWLAEGRLGGMPAVLVVFAAYCAFQVAFISISSHVAGTGVSYDDGEQLVYMRHLWLGYGGSQPPLYTWMAWLIGQVLGPTILTLKLLKYTLIFLGMVLLHHLVRSLGYTGRTAVAAMLGVTLLPQVFWELQRRLSHSAALFCFAMAFLVCLFAVSRQQSWRNYGLLGLAIGAAVLSKYNNAFLVAAGLGAVAISPRTRHLVLSKGILFTLAVAALVISPVLIWALTHTTDLMDNSFKLKMDSAGSLPEVAWTGFNQFVRAGVNGVLLPLAVTGLAMAMFRIRPWNGFASPDHNERMLWRMIALVLLLTAVAVLSARVTHVEERWLLPVLLLVPIALAIGLEALGMHGVRAQNFVISIGACAAIVILPFTWFAQLGTGHGMDRMVRMNPESLYRAIRQKGEVRTVVSSWPWIGSLRLADPELKALFPRMPNFASLVEDPAVLVWEDETQPGRRILPALAAIGYAPAGEPTFVQVSEFLGPPDGRRFSFVRLKRIPLESTP